MLFELAMPRSFCQEPTLRHVSRVVAMVEHFNPQLELDQSLVSIGKTRLRATSQDPHNVAAWLQERVDSVDEALEVYHVEQGLAVREAWRATIRTTRSKHGVAQSSNADANPCSESLARSVYTSSSLERAFDTNTVNMRTPSPSYILHNLAFFTS